MLVTDQRTKDAIKIFCCMARLHGAPCIFCTDVWNASGIKKYLKILDKFFFRRVFPENIILSSLFKSKNTYFNQSTESVKKETATSRKLTYLVI